MSQESSRFPVFHFVVAALLGTARRVASWLSGLRSEHNHRAPPHRRSLARDGRFEASADVQKEDDNGPTSPPVQALPSLEEMLRWADETRDPMNYRFVGFTLSQDGRLDDAVKAYRLAIDAGDLGAYTNLGTVLAKMGRITEALEVYRAAIATGAERAHYNLGTLLFKEGRLAEAEGYLRKAVAEGNDKAPLNLGATLEHLGRGDEAIEMYRHAINVGDTMAYKALGLLLAKEHRFQEASEVFQRAIVSGITQLHFESGATLWMLGDYRRAEEEYRAAIEIGDERAPYALGVLLDELERPQEAIAALRQAQALGDTAATERLQRVEEGPANGTLPPGYAVPAPWKVTLLRMIGENVLADQMERRLDEADDEPRDRERGTPPVGSIADSSQRLSANPAIGDDHVQVSPVGGYKELRSVRVFVSSTFKDMHAERDELARHVFPHLSKLCAGRGVIWGDVDLRWGITDTQQSAGEVLPICLARVDDCRPFFIAVLGERYGIEQESPPRELIEREPWLRQHAGCSITELEILHGVLNDPEKASHAFVYFRDPAYVNNVPPDQRANFIEGPTPEDVLRCGATTAARLADARRGKLASLKQRIRSSGVATREYSSVQEFGELVLADLTASIERTYPGEDVDDLAREALDHDAFAQTRHVVYIPRSAYIRQLDDHVGTDGPPLIVTGAQGVGKSALLAHWSSLYRQRHSTDLVLTHFVGATASSSDWVALVRRLIRECHRRCGIQEKVPEEPDALRSAFAKSLHMVAFRGRVVLLIDGVNQLDDRDHARELVWLPRDIPPAIRLVLSTVPGKALEDFAQRGWPRMDVEPLTVREREQLIVRYLMQLYGKRLDPSLAARLASAPQTGIPAYLLAIVEELRIHEDRDTLQQRMDDYLAASTVSELYEKILERYEKDYERERPGLIRDAMSYLWAARRGLSEAELLDLLGPRQQPLPQAFWSPFYIAADRLLIRRTALIGFWHESLRQAVAARYIDTNRQATELHLALADYFSQQELSHRKVDELPWQLAKAHAWERLAHLLSDLEFLDAAFQNGFDVRFYWAEIEAQSAHRMMATYAPILDTVTVSSAWNLAMLFERTGHTDEAAALTRRLALHYARLLRAEIEPARDIAPSGGTDVESIVDSLNLLQAALQRMFAPSLQDADVRGADLRNDRDQRGKAWVLGQRLQTALSNYAHILLAQQRYDETLQVLLSKEPVCKALGLDDGLAESLGIRASILTTRGEPFQALELLKQQEEIYRRRGETHLVYVTLGNQARALDLLGKLDEAIALHKEVEYHCRQIGDMDGLTTSLGSQASILFLQEKFESAMALHQEEENICRRTGNWQGVAASLGDQALILRAHGELSVALAALKSAERIYRESGNRSGVMSSLANQAMVLFECNDLEGAMTGHKDVERLARELGAKDALQHALGGQGRILRMRGDVDGAMRLFDEKERICREMGDTRGIMEVCIAKGIASEKQGDMDRAMLSFQQAEALCRQTGSDDVLAKSLAGQARVLEAQDDLVGATILNQQVEDICRRAGNKRLLQLVLRRQAAIYQRQGELEKANELFEEHTRVCRYLGIHDLRQSGAEIGKAGDTGGSTTSAEEE